uniref:Rab GTPase n=1 Tax=Schistosoma mansoni TaxID=6183 RepID=A0A5K4EWJ0_SCHMA
MGENLINERFSQMDNSNKGDYVTEIPKRISRVRKASEISDSTTLYKNKPRTTSLPLNDLLTSSSEKFNQTLENLYNETDSKLIQEEELMRQRLKKKCEELKNNTNQIIEEKEEQTEILREKLKQISILTDELQKETEDDKCIMEKAKTQCQSILDEIEECEQLIDESKEDVKELQTMKKVESIKKEKADVTACHKIQEEREILMKKEINRCLRDLKDETSNDKDSTDYERILSPEAFHVNENKNEEELLKRTHFSKLPIRHEDSKDEESEEMKNAEDTLDNNSKRSFELNDSKSLIFKVLLIGSFGVGKQALLNRLSSNNSNQPLDLDEKKNNLTISSSSSYEIKIAIYQRKLDNVNYLIQFMKPPTIDFLNLHDYIGHKTCRTFYEKSDGIILIFDIWSKETLFELEKYYYTTKENQNQLIRKPIYMVLGNKIDLLPTQSNILLNKVPDKRIIDFVNDLDGTFFEISAKSGENVQEAIDVFLRKLKLASEKTNQSNEIKKDKKMGCCSCCFL